MQQNLWLIFWTILLVIGLGTFAIMAVVVAIGGAMDIRALFKSLAEEHQHGDSSDTHR